MIVCVAQGNAQATKRVVRITVPLLNAGVNHDGNMWRGRMELAPGVIFATLDEPEASRVMRIGTRYGVGSACRLEIHGLEVEYAHWSELADANDYEVIVNKIDSQVTPIVTTYLGLLSLAVRMCPTWPGIALDVEGEASWVRLMSLPLSGGFGDDKYSYLPMARLETWGRLIKNWPHHAAATVNQSLEYYYQSVTDRPQHTAKGLTSAAIAFESLLGRGLQQELSYRLSQRGALLVAKGDEAVAIAKYLRDSYTARSKLVHDAVMPSCRLPRL
jgi:hypothetical protein